MLFQLFQYNNYESIFGTSVWSQLYTRYRTLKTPGVWSSALQFSTLYCVAGTQTLRMLLINSRNLPQMWTSGSRHHKRLCNINLRSILILRARSPHDKSLRLRHRRAMTPLASGLGKVRLRLIRIETRKQQFPQARWMAAAEVVSSIFTSAAAVLRRRRRRGTRTYDLSQHQPPPGPTLDYRD